MEEVQALLARFLAELTKPQEGPKAQARKAKVPKCRCGAAIPSDWHICARCSEWEDQDWRAGGPDRRLALNVIVKEVCRLT